MDKVKNVAKKLLTPRSIMTIIVIAIFIASAVFAYNKYVKPKLNPSYVPNKEFIEEGSDSNEAMVYYFTAQWCPISKRVFPQWEKFVGDYDGKKINGYVLRTRVVDCEKETELADQFKIEEYPTIKLAFDNQIVEYDANVKYDTLVEFVNSSLGGQQ